MKFSIKKKLMAILPLLLLALPGGSVVLLGYLTWRKFYRTEQPLLPIVCQAYDDDTGQRFDIH